ncbi:MAG: RNA polymerase sigma factor region1.1 domain-containing protein [Gammaproteobacteria bacterium]
MPEKAQASAGPLKTAETSSTAAEQSAPQSELKNLVLKGKAQGFLTYAEINDHLPEEHPGHRPNRSGGQHDQRHGRTRIADA